MAVSVPAALVELAQAGVAVEVAALVVVAVAARGEVLPQAR